MCGVVEHDTIVSIARAPVLSTKVNANAQASSARVTLTSCYCSYRIPSSCTCFSWTKEAFVDLVFGQVLNQISIRLLLLTILDYTDITPLTTCTHTAKNSKPTPEAPTWTAIRAALALASHHKTLLVILPPQRTRTQRRRRRQRRAVSYRHGRA